MSSFINRLREQSALLKKRIAFPDATDARTLRASLILNDLGICSPILIGIRREIEQIAVEHGLSIGQIPIVEPINSPEFEEYALKFAERRAEKGMTLEQAREYIKNPLYYAGMMADSNVVDGCVAGSLSTTGDVLRAGIQTVGIEKGISVVSSFFLMVFADKILCYTDCGVVPEPNEEQLADIALSAARNFQKITNVEPRIAFLSFSTWGSAEHPAVLKVRRAALIFHDKAPTVISDGELQADAALIPEIANRKAPNSAVGGNANILVFPDLNAGNISYKLTERLAGAQALGPIIQGLNRPYCDLSRGCSVEDIVNIAAICSLMV
ncbi:MAG: phosphate acetyltransferase [Ignavibacteriae bacterium]|nr:phosphate acetyltransferase [Ignavibacteriota bacterium]